jgi:hypothetical protein
MARDHLSKNGLSSRTGANFRGETQHNDETQPLHTSLPRCPWPKFPTGVGHGPFAYTLIANNCYRAVRLCAHGQSILNFIVLIESIGRNFLRAKSLVTHPMTVEQEDLW